MSLPASNQNGNQNLHHALFFGSDVELVDLAVPFLRAGLADGDALLLVCDEPKNALLLDALHGDNTRITCLERFTIYQRTAVAVDRYRRVIERLVRDGARRVRLVGEVDFGETAATWAEWARFEAVVNVALARYPYWNVCAYDTRTLPEPILAAGLATHPKLLTAAGRTSNNQYEEPAALLRRWAVHDPDPIEASDPAFAITVTHPTQLPAARDRLHAELTRAGVPPLLRSDLVLAVGEIVTNGLVHGRPPVQVGVWSAPDRVVATVADRGDGIDDPLAGFVPPHRGEPLPAGMGLWLVRLLCEQVQMSSAVDGFTVRLITRFAEGTHGSDHSGPAQDRRIGSNGSGQTEGHPQPTQPGGALERLAAQASASFDHHGVCGLSRGTALGHCRERVYTSEEALSLWGMPCTIGVKLLLVDPSHDPLITGQTYRITDPGKSGASPFRYVPYHNIPAALKILTSPDMSVPSTVDKRLSAKNRQGFGGLRSKPTLVRLPHLEL